MGNSLSKSKAAGLASQANEAHAKGEQCRQRALKSAHAAFRAFKRAGDSLLKAKEEVGHGEWRPWVEKNLEFSIETAQVYMRIATEWKPSLQDAVKNGEIFSLRQARAYLTGPTPKEKQEVIRIAKEATRHVLSQLERVKRGLPKTETFHQSAHYIFQEGKLRTFDGIVAYEVESPLDIEGAINGHQLRKVIGRVADDNKLEFAVQDQFFHISGKNRKAMFKIEPIEREWEIDKPAGKWKQISDPDAFKEALGMVVECAGRDAAQNDLTCVHVTPKYVEATNQLSACRYWLKTGFKDSFLVPREVVSHVVNLGGELQGYNLTKNWLHLHNRKSGIMLSTRRYSDQSYPQMNSEFKTVKRMDRQLNITKRPLERAVSIANLFDDETAQESRLITVELNSDSLTITNSGKSGSYSETLAVKTKGKPFTFTMPPSELLRLAKKSKQWRMNDTALAIQGDEFTYILTVGASSPPVNTDAIAAQCKSDVNPTDGDRLTKKVKSS